MLNLEKFDCIFIFFICNIKLFLFLSNVSYRCVSFINILNRCYWDSVGLILKFCYVVICFFICMVCYFMFLVFIFIICVIGFFEIFVFMMRREIGSKILRFERVLLWGDLNFNGMVMVLV